MDCYIGIRAYDPRVDPNTILLFNRMQESLKQAHDGFAEVAKSSAVLREGMGELRQEIEKLRQAIIRREALRAAQAADEEAQIAGGKILGGDTDEPVPDLSPLPLTQITAASTDPDAGDRSALAGSEQKDESRFARAEHDSIDENSEGALIVTRGFIPVVIKVTRALICINNNRTCADGGLCIEPANPDSVRYSEVPDVTLSSRLAAEGIPFTVTYHSRIGPREFVVPRMEVKNYIDPSSYLLAAKPSSALCCFAIGRDPGVSVALRRFLPAAGGEQRPVKFTVNIRAQGDVANMSDPGLLLDLKRMVVFDPGIYTNGFTLVAALRALPCNKAAEWLAVHPSGRGTLCLSEQYERALKFSHEMWHQGVVLLLVTYNIVLDYADHEKTRRVLGAVDLALVVVDEKRRVLDMPLLAGMALLRIAALPWPPPFAHNLFDEMLTRNVISCNTGILVKIGCKQSLCSKHRGPPPPPWPPPPELPCNLFKEMSATGPIVEWMQSVVYLNYSAFLVRHWNMIAVCKGLLGGFMVVTVGCRVVDPWAAIIRGFISVRVLVEPNARIPKIEKSVEHSSHQELRSLHVNIIRIVTEAYNKLLFSCNEQMAYFATSLVNIFTELLESRQENIHTLDCQPLARFISNLERAASLQCLSAMIWFMEGLSYIIADEMLSYGGNDVNMSRTTLRLWSARDSSVLTREECEYSEELSQLHKLFYTSVPSECLDDRERDAVKRNTSFIYGVVIFTGHDSKVMQNSTESSSRRSSSETNMDLIIYILFAVSALISLISSIGFAVRIKLDMAHWWYL